ncbi:hypothetical protein DICPUDRAFT_18495, partial [Dictyostelium purpureum]
SEDFMCQICSEIIYNKLMRQCLNGHVFCEECWKSSLVRKKECCVCRVPVKSIDELSRNRTIENLFLKTKIHCPFSLEQVNFQIKDENGCKEVLLVENLKSHMDKCLFQIIDCKFSKEGCTKRFKKQLLEDHIKECEYRFISCSDCGMDFRISYIPIHSSECPKKSVPCIQKCYKNVVRCEMNKHTDNECGNTVMECKYKEAGCEKRYLRKNQNVHFS